jgi:hypothetical protein
VCRAETLEGAVGTFYERGVVDDINGEAHGTVSSCEPMI